MPNCAATASSTLATVSNAASTHVDPYYISDWERTNYYHGTFRHPPKLLYRSDLLSNPFPKPVGEHPRLVTKTMHAVGLAQLNDIWYEALTQISRISKARNIPYTIIGSARFRSDDGIRSRRGPAVVWITIRHDTATTKDLHDASADILAYLQANGVEDIVVEWAEGFE